MITKVYEDIYMIKVELPNNPLRELNVYVIKGQDKSLIIDTGFNQQECIDGLFSGLRELDIDIKDTELFITHLHSDHSGMAGFFQEAGVKIYTGEKDGRVINEMIDDSYWEKFDELKILFDLDKDDTSFSQHPGYKYSMKTPVRFNYLGEGDKIRVGKYTFELVFIPGHTPGHMGLYEKDHKIFFCGDHILDRITPNIGFWGFEDNILATYFNSLAKVYFYEIDHLFTSHRGFVKDHKKRINELLLHHNDRLKEIIEILKAGEFSVRDVAARMVWSIRAKDWNDFPGPQKWFATEEAMSHLQHLYFTGKIGREFKDGKLYYGLK